MIIREKNESYDGSFRILKYEADDQGKLAERAIKSDLDDQIETFYTQRQLEMERLEREVLAGKISPIALCMTYQSLTLSDLAARVKLSKRKVQKHLTPAGFADVTVAMLQRYARVFDLNVADFFEFVRLPEGIEVERAQRQDRLIQLLTVFTAPQESVEMSESDHETD